MNEEVMKDVLDVVKITMWMIVRLKKPVLSVQTVEEIIVQLTGVALK